MNLGVQPKLIFNNQYFIYFMNWKKLGSSVRAIELDFRLYFLLDVSIFTTIEDEKEVKTNSSSILKDFT